MAIRTDFLRNAPDLLVWDLINKEMDRTNTITDTINKMGSNILSIGNNHLTKGFITLKIGRFKI
jgi:hypothetical protein